MNVTELYWQQAVTRLPELHESGYIKLDPLPVDLASQYFEKIALEMCDETFRELGVAHAQMLDDIGIHEYFVPSLYAFARKHFAYRGPLENQYHVARLVRATDSFEAYRTHFDSHLFTLVMPLSIPECRNIEESGALYFLPKARTMRDSEIVNLLQKIYFKRYSGRLGQKAMSTLDNYCVETFTDIRPILFVGTTTLHGNFPLALSESGERLTMLAHFFDPAGGLGIGKLLRLLRSR